jgi:hypothetical protein
MVCCGWCSAQMAARTARGGLSSLMTNEAHAMRKAGGRPHNHGNTASELREGAKIALGVTLANVNIADIPNRLRAGFAVCVGLQYGQLPAWLKVQTNDFGHAVCLFGWDELDDRAGFFDPLWSQGAAGAWVPWSAIANAVWPNKNHSTTVSRIGGGTLSGIYWNPARYKATKDIPVYLDPTFGTHVTTIKSGAVFTQLGPKAVVDADGKDGSARAILVTTGGLVPGTADPGVKAVLWIKGADAGTDQGAAQAWDDSIWALALDPDGRYPATGEDEDCDDEVTAAIMTRDSEWEDALKHGEAWPGQ